MQGNHDDKTKYEAGETVCDSISDSGATVLDGGSSAYDSGATFYDESDDKKDVVIENGATLLDTYRIESDAIEGGMGKVWRVHHTGWNVELAMKQPKAALFQSQHQKDNFIHECEAWINLGLHPHIVSCYYVREIRGIPAIFSEWMDGGSLKDVIENGSLYEGNAEERLLDIAIQFARGLHYAHECRDENGQPMGLIHQDVKPDNLLLTKAGEAKVADFGISKARAVLTMLEENADELGDYADSGRTMHAASGGYTPAYCSMEQMNGQTITRRTDIYSWAVSVMEMYLGERPWTNGVIAGAACENYFPEARVVAVPEAMKALLKECLNQAESERPHDFAVVEEKLLAIYKAETGNEYTRLVSKAAANTSDSLNNRALSFLDLGKPEEAQKCWERALKTDPNHSDSYFNLTLSQWRNGKLSDLQTLKQLDGTLLRADEKKKRFYAALIHMERGRYADARKALLFTDIPEEKQLQEWLEAKISLDRLSDNAPVLAQGIKLTKDSMKMVLGNRALLYCAVDDHDLCLEPAYANNDLHAMTLTGHTAAVGYLAVSMDGRHAASASEDGTIRIWDIVQGSCLYTLPISTTAMAFDQGGRLWLMDPTQSALICADGKTPPLLSNMKPDGNVYAMAISGKTLFTSSNMPDGGSRLCAWNIDSGMQKGSFQSDFKISEMRIRPDGDTVSVTDGKSTAAVYQLRTGLELIRRVFRNTGFTALTPDGGCVQTCDNYGKTGLALYELISGRLLRSDAWEQIVAGAVWADATHLLLHCARKAGASFMPYLVPVRAVASPRRASYQLCCIQTVAQRLSLEKQMRQHRDEAEAAFAAGDIKTALLEVQKARGISGYEKDEALMKLNACIGHRCKRTSLHGIELKEEREYAHNRLLSCDITGTKLLTVQDNCLKVCNEDNGQDITSVPLKQKEKPQAICLGPNGRYAAVKYATKEPGSAKLELWNLQRRKRILELRYPRYGLYGIYFFPNADWVVVGMPEGDAVIYDLESGRERERKHIFNNPVPAKSMLDYSGVCGIGVGGEPKRWYICYMLPEGKDFFYDSQGIWFKGERVPLTKPVSSLEGTQIKSVYFSKDQQAVALVKGKSCVIESKSGEVGFLSGYLDVAAVSPDNRFLICAGGELVYIVSWETGEVIHKMNIENSECNSCAYSVSFGSDGNRIHLIVNNKRYVWHLDWDYEY